ncbi:uncharacterized protein LOC111928939 [Cyanistes caeruleus]|uniref:uncharacterized protein LOC111928939 n=1 Tax=Cyanistes caeruleus TaxID=156563 RepID=UPI000CDB40CD|nr:uncharacterized protein LOC111928939 [Cyanistes caeruleus]
MSSRQQKRPGEALDSTPARKRSRLLPSRAAGTLQTEQIDREESASPALEPEVIDLTGDSPEPEVITISDDESPVQSPQQPRLSRASDNSPEPLERNNGEEPGEDDGDWLLFEFDPPYWSDEDSQLPEVHGEEKKTAALNSQEQVDGSANGSGANDAPVADAAPAEHGAEEDTGSSAAEPGVVISCPICMDYYSEIMQSGRQRGVSVFSIPAANREPYVDGCAPNSGLTVQRQRKRPGEALDSTPARKRSRLLPSRAAGTLQTEQIDRKESASPALEPEVIDLTRDSPEPEVITISDDESPVRQRKRPGEALDSTPARKRSRLLPSRAAGTLQTEQIDCEESASPALEPAISNRA